MKVIEKVSVILELILLFMGLGFIIASIITKDVIMLVLGAVVYLSSSLYFYTARLGNKIDELLKNQ